MSRVLRNRYRWFWAAVVFTVLSSSVFLIWMFISIGGELLTGRVDEIGEGVAAIIGAGACFVVARRESGRLRWAWVFIGAGMVAWGAGEGVWCWYDIAEHVAVPFPSAADIGFLTEVPLLVVGVLCFPASAGNVLSRLRVSLDGLVIGGSLLAVSWGTVLGAAYHAGGGTHWAEAIGLAYPLSDVAVATIAFSTLARTGRRYRTSLSVLITGLIALSVSDSAFVYLQQTTTYANGDVVDAGWVIGFLILGCAALWPGAGPRTESEERHPLSTWQVVLPYGFLGAAGSFILAKYFLDRHLDAFLTADGLVLVVIVLARQVVSLLEDAQLTRSLERQTKLDPLTGIGNRVLFSERVNSALARSISNDKRIAVLLCDLDNFKDVNDTLGHSTGDQLLVTVAQRLTQSVRPGDLVARLGGDEFAVVLEADTTNEQAVGVAIRVIDSMQAPLSSISEECVPFMSIGLAMQAPGHVSSEDILREADVALYAAKAAGGNCCRVFEPRLGRAHFDNLRFQSEFSSALDHGQFFLEFEPIVDLVSGVPVGVEALVRWRHPTRGPLAPKYFLQLAESSGAIVPIGRWVLEQALTELQEWRTGLPGADELWIAVNLSSRQLVSGELMTGVLEALERTGTEPHSLRLELTESALVRQDEASLQLLDSLKAMGVHLTIDDFGTGYSSLSYLKHLPVDALKIDRMFIGDVNSEPYDALIVESVIRLAHARGMEVVAEGIETNEQLIRVRDLDCDLGQGFFWSQPQRAADFRKWLERRYEQVRAANAPEK